MFYIIGYYVAQQATDPIPIKRGTADRFGVAEFKCNIERTELSAELLLEDLPSA